MLAQLERLASERLIGDLDLHFARLLARLGGADEAVVLAACLVSRAQANGDVCLDLRQAAGQAVLAAEGESALCAPALDEWLAALRASPVVGAPGDYRPLVLDPEGRLYLYRYWDYERRLAAALRARLAAPAPSVDEARLREGLARLFPEPAPSGIDWQRVAAAAAVLRPFCIVSGGPGTGKTTTMVKMLALLVEQAGDASVAISLAAPTGKAAARMQEAVRQAKAVLPLTPRVRDAIPESAATLHRLLGGIPDSARFRHDRDNPLAADVLVVDEASMVDLALMTRLVEALRPTARLVLLGDKDQLASVESGAVLGDLCAEGAVYSKPFAAALSRVTGAKVAAQAASAATMRDAILLLQHNYRFSGTSAIKRLADEIRGANAEGALAALAAGAQDAAWHALAGIEELQRKTVDRAAAGYASFLAQVKQGGEADAVLDAFAAFRVLSALRQGPAGTVRLNRLIDEACRAALGVVGRDPWYPGRPVIVTRNDYNLRLYNGDIGVALPDPARPGELAVCFKAAEGGLRRLAPNRLPEHETAYAMTVHKSQGSEFERVLLLLPPDDSPVLSRELVYTAVTRARAGVEVLGSVSVLRAAIARSTSRASGLRARLAEEAESGEGGQQRFDF